MRFTENGLKNIVGLNRRNLEIISVHNKRKHYPIVDNKLTKEELKKHLSDIIFGVYSFGSSGDSAIIEKRVYPHSVFTDIYSEGVADLRVISFECKPIMAMLRIPTGKSDGKANLHQGAIGIPVNMDTGKTGNAMIKGKVIEAHPDSGAELAGKRIPFWKNIINLAIKSSELIPLGYIGIDFVIDQNLGPLVLELNARPGLQIQVINDKGLAPLIFGEKDDF